jgi:hypothetical protein
MIFFRPELADSESERDDMDGSYLYALQKTDGIPLSKYSDENTVPLRQQNANDFTWPLIPHSVP